MIILNKGDILKSISYTEMMGAIEDAYIVFAEKKFSIPLRIKEDIGDNTFLLMSCANKQVFGTKILTFFPQNIQKGKSNINGVMVLHEIETGEIKSIMDAKIVIALRTGAVGGLAINYLSPKDANSVGIIGAGMQGFYQAIYASNVRKLKSIQVFDQRITGLGCFAKRLAEVITYPIEINICNTVEELLISSQIVVTTTTSKKPVIPNNTDLIKNKCFIGIGSCKPSMREYPESVFKCCEKIFIDTDYAISETGDLITPICEGWITKNDITMFNDIIRSGEKVKASTVLFKSVGMSLFDFFAAQKIIKSAKEKDIGQKIIF